MECSRIESCDMSLRRCSRNKGALCRRAVGRLGKILFALLLLGKTHLLFAPGKSIETMAFSIVASALKAMLQSIA